MCGFQGFIGRPVGNSGRATCSPTAVLLVLGRGSETEGSANPRHRRKRVEVQPREETGGLFAAILGGQRAPSSKYGRAECPRLHLAGVVREPAESFRLSYAWPGGRLGWLGGVAVLGARVS